MQIKTISILLIIAIGFVGIAGILSFGFMDDGPMAALCHLFLAQGNCLSMVGGIASIVLHFSQFQNAFAAAFSGALLLSTILAGLVAVAAVRRGHSSSDTTIGARIAHLFAVRFEAVIPSQQLQLLFWSALHNKRNVHLFVRVHDGFLSAG